MIRGLETARLNEIHTVGLITLLPNRFAFAGPLMLKVWDEFGEKFAGIVFGVVPRECLE